MNNIGKNIAIWLIIGLVLMTVFNQFSKKHEPQSQMAYSEFIDEVRQGGLRRRDRGASAAGPDAAR